MIDSLQTVADPFFFSGANNNLVFFQTKYYISFIKNGNKKIIKN